MNYSTQPELVENQALPVTGFDMVPSILLKPALIILFYFSSLSIGMYKVNYLSDSTLVYFISNIFGPCAATLCGSIAYVIAFIIPYKYEFANEVFNLGVYNEFRVSITLAFLLLPFAAIIARIINRTFTSYLFRKFIFITVIIITLPILYLSNEFLNKFNDKSAFIFSFAVFGIIYYAIFSCVSSDYNTRNPRMGDR